MSYLKPQQREQDAEWQRLLREKVGGDSQAVQQVEALIEHLRQRQQWQPAPPAPDSGNRVPHS